MADTTCALCKQQIKSLSPIVYIMMFLQSLDGSTGEACIVGRLGCACVAISNSTALPPPAFCPQVREVELSMDMPSILRLLDFLEALFNGGSDFNEPLKRCLNRLTDAKWANSDILLVSGACLLTERECINTVGRPAESPIRQLPHTCLCTCS